jgi:hypothetical protein
LPRPHAHPRQQRLERHPVGRRLEILDHARL